jgi:hypothetical protein
MNFLRIPMWEDVRKLLLTDILLMLSLKEPISWRLYEFSGVGVAPANMEMSTFERYVRESKSGYFFTDEELRSFSRNITDITDIRLVGFLNEKKVVEVNGLDSDIWEIWTDEIIVEANSITGVDPLPDF